MTNNIRSIYSDALIADFLPTVKVASVGNAVCLHLNLEESKFGYCTMKSLLDKHITGSLFDESVIDNSGFSPECTSLISEIMEYHWDNAVPITA